MSKLIVEVCVIEEVVPHSNADRLDVYRVKNWWCVGGKGQYHVGDKVVYVPPDAVLSVQLSDRWGITKYCTPLAGDPTKVRVRACKFRGTPSFGTLQNLDDEWPVGKDVREYFDITKYEPPLKSTDGDAAAPVPAFHHYTDIENIGNYPNVFEEGEEVVVTEKIHGTNSRVGLVLHVNDDTGSPEWMYMAGSHGVRRKEFNEKGVRSRYWFPLNTQVQNLLNDIANQPNQKADTSVIVFGEIFGSGVQDMTYGQSGLNFRVFDIAVDHRYLDHADATLKAEFHTVQWVPELYRGPFSMAKMHELVDGPTTVCATSDIREPFKGREGIVIKPVKESFSPALGGRKILKYVSADYHDRKNKDKTEDH